VGEDVQETQEMTVALDDLELTVDLDYPAYLDKRENRVCNSVTVIFSLVRCYCSYYFFNYLTDVEWIHNVVYHRE